MRSRSIFTVETVQQTLIVIPQGDVSSLEEDDIHAEMHNVIQILTAASPVNVIVDLKLAPFFGSTMLGALIKLWQKVVAFKSTMVLCNTSEFQIDVLHATKLDSVWKIYPTRAEALTALHAPKQP